MCHWHLAPLQNRTLASWGAHHWRVSVSWGLLRQHHSHSVPSPAPLASCDAISPWQGVWALLRLPLSSALLLQVLAVSCGATFGWAWVWALLRLPLFPALLLQVLAVFCGATFGWAWVQARVLQRQAWRLHHEALLSLGPPVAAPCPPPPPFAYAGERSAGLTFLLRSCLHASLAAPATACQPCQASGRFTSGPLWGPHYMPNWCRNSRSGKGWPTSGPSHTFIVPVIGARAARRLPANVFSSTTCSLPGQHSQGSCPPGPYGAANGVVVIRQRSLLLHVQLPFAASTLKLPQAERRQVALLSALVQFGPSWRQLL